MFYLIGKSYWIVVENYRFCLIKDEYRYRDNGIEFLYYIYFDLFVMFDCF